MTSKINAITTGSGGIEVTGDSSGEIEFQADGLSVATATSTGFNLTGTGSLTIPSGTTAQRPSSPSAGMIRYNTETNKSEFYNGTNWLNIDAQSPDLESISPTDFDGETGTTITLTGSFFSSDCVVQFKKTGGSYVNATSTTFVNSKSVTATTPEDYDLTESPISVKITQASGESELVDALTAGAAPTWVTASGQIAAVNSGASINTSVSATDDGSIDSYAITSGSLPSGVTLNTSTGAITGTAPSNLSDVTSTFDVTVTDNAGNTSTRSFNILVYGTQYTIEYLTVAGGGGGGAGHAGGAGAGGYIASSTTVNTSTGYTITVGGGGTRGVYNTSTPTNGANSSAFGSTSIGGGRGGGQNQPNNATKDGASGGSGGGGANAYGAGTGYGGAGTAGQGNAGGNGQGGASWAGGGGGGANNAGATNASTILGGAGGNGKTWLNGNTYAGGGGGGGGDGGSAVAGSGGSGGGGSGRIGGAGAASAGTANTGGGGGGARDSHGGNGGSGVVIVRYSGSQKGSGGTITSSGGYTYHTFSSSGTYTA